MVVYDRIPGATVYQSNTTITGWTMQYSYSASPDQAFTSADYTNMPASVNSNIQWVRWIRTPVPVGDTGSFTYRVIIK